MVYKSTIATGGLAGPVHAPCEICGDESDIHVCIPLVVDLLKKDEEFKQMIADIIDDI